MARFLIAVVCFLCVAIPVRAADSTTAPLPEAPIDRYDFASLQRGAAAFVGNCLGCHSAKYVRYNRVAADLGIPEDLLAGLLIYDEDVAAGDGMVSAMRPDEATEWFHRATPPDLSLSAKLRGADWLYGYLRGFYRDPATSSGWNNSVFPNVAMPHVLAYMQGEYRHDAENGGQVQTKAGLLSPGEYDAYILDLVNFMDYLADPAMPTRHRYGYIFLIALFILSIIAYLLYREYWRDVH